jgi:hypothetical protein
MTQTVSNLRPPRVMLIGSPGSGKTHSLRTLIANGITPFIVATEYPDILEDTPKDKCHWHYIEPGKADWATLKDNAEKINLLSNDALQKLPGVNKDKYRQFFEIIATCANFKCDRTGESYGDASTWGPDRALVIDSLSGLSIMARDLAVGAKPIITQPDWGVMMQNLEQFINACTTGTKCFFILTAHPERELDEAVGSSKVMASTLGRKLAPKLPRFFSDVVMCRREGTKFSWDTAAIDVDVKWRNLPLAGNLQPDFGQMVRAWRDRLAKAA